MKNCSICQTVKPLSDFNKKSRNKDGLQNVCRECNSARSKQYYRDNHDKHIRVVKGQQAKYAHRNRAFLVEYLSTHHCVDCGYSDIRALEFDHLRDKRLGVGRLIAYGCSLETLKQEIEKCEVRCRNCHQIKTMERAGGSWHDTFLAVVV